MLEAYLAFARGDAGEQDELTNIPALLDDLRADTERHGHGASVAYRGQPEVIVKPAAFKRCLANLVTNAARYAHSIAITGHRDHRWLTVTIDDDGPGIPEDKRELLLQRGVRGDERVQGHGIGLAIVQDIVRSYRGQLTVEQSPELGGARFHVRFEATR